MKLRLVFLPALAGVLFLLLDAWAPGNLSSTQLLITSILLATLLLVITASPRARRGARLATDKEIKDRFGTAVVPQPRIFLGAYKDTPLYTSAAHLLIAAGTGAGKTVGLAIPTVLLSTKAMWIVDPKGEIYDHTHSYRRTLGPVFRIGLEEGDLGFSPLDWLALQPGTFESAAAAELACGVVDSAKDSGDFFTSAATLLWLGGLMYGARQINQGNATTLLDTLTLLRDPQRIQALLDSGALSPDEEHAFDFISKLSDDARADVIGTALAKFQITPRVRRFLTRAERLRRQDLQGTYTCYLTFSPVDIDAQSIFFRLLLRLIIEERLSHFDPSADHVQILIDEAAQLGRMAWLQKKAAITRGYGLQIIYIYQSMRQILNLYGRDEAWTIHFGAFCFFGVRDLETAETVSKFIGEVEIRMMKRSASSGSGRGSSITVTADREQVRLILPSEVLAAPPGTAFLIAPPVFPVFPVHVIPWYTNQELTNLVRLSIPGAGRR